MSTRRLSTVLLVGQVFITKRKVPKDLSWFVWLQGLFLPRGVRCLGERCFSASNLGSAETEVLGYCYLDTRVCICCCIYSFSCVNRACAGRLHFAITRQSNLFRPHQRYTVRHRFPRCEQLYTSLFCLTLFIIGGLLHLTTSVSVVEAPGTAPGS